MFGSMAMGSTILATAVLTYLFYGSASEGSLLQAPIGMMMISGMTTSAAFIQCAFGHSSEEQAKECCTQPTGGSTKAGCC